MKIVLAVVISVIWIFLTQILSGILSTIICWPFLYLKKRSDFSDFLVSILSSLIVLYIGINLFILLGLDKLLLFIPIVMLFAYYKSLNYTKNEPGATAIKYGSYLGVILGIFIFGLL
jgi:hypothetical protein